MQCCKWTGMVLTFVLVMTAFSTPVFGAVPSLINYQGRLDDSTGTPVADGNYTMRFYLYDAETGGNQLWNPDDGEEQEVAVSQGLFNVHLGKYFSVDSSMFDTGGVWLEIAVYNHDSRSWETLKPRQQVTAVAYALKAGDADTLDGNPAGAFALTDHEHDTVYVNEGQAGAVTSVMIAGSSITNTHLADHAVTGGKILDNSITAADLAPGAVTGSELADQSVTAGKIKWSINYTGSDLHGGILSLTNVADASPGNYPMGVYGAADGDPQGHKPVMGVFGGTPGFVPGSAITRLPVNRIGVGGASDTGHGVAGVTHSGTGVFGTSGTGTGGYFSSDGNYGYGVYGTATNDGNDANYGGYFLAAGTIGRAVYGRSTHTGLHANYGGHFTAAGAYGLGVYGASTHTGNYMNYGGYFTAAGGGGRAVYGSAVNTGDVTNYGGYFSASGLNGRGVYAGASGGSGRGVHAYATGANGRGVYAYTTGDNAYAIEAFSAGSDGIYAATGASNEHAGYFFTNVASGLAGAALYARTDNFTGQGIAFWAHNDHTSSTDTAVVISNDGTGPLLKGFGGNGGEDEFRIDNDGTMRFFNSSHVETVRISPSQDGSGRVVTQVLEITGGSDLSEQFVITEQEIPPAPGMVVSIDPDQPGHLAVSRMAYDNKVAGIISGAGGIKSGMMMGQKGSVADGQHPVALTGRVYCQANASSHAIRPGDLLTTSDLPGHAMKVTDHGRANGAILGKAMTSLDAGTGLVLVLVSLQ